MPDFTFYEQQYLGNSIPSDVFLRLIKRVRNVHKLTKIFFRFFYDFIINFLLLW